jgi:hypothetical protein
MTSRTIRRWRAYQHGGDGRGSIARAFPDPDEVVEKVSDITAGLIGVGTHACGIGNCAWLEPHQWFTDALDRLLSYRRAVSFGA